MGLDSKGLVVSRDSRILDCYLVFKRREIMMISRKIRLMIFGVSLWAMLVITFFILMSSPACRAGVCSGSVCVSNSGCLSGCVCAIPFGSGQGVCTSAD